MNCSNCGSKVDRGWKYCPRCGSNLGSGAAGNDIFSQVFRELDDMGKNMGFKDADMEVIDLSKMFNEVMKSMGNPEKRGFSVRIRQRNDEPPKVSFRKFGDDNSVANKHRIFPKLRKPIEGKPVTHKISIKLPKETEEPETQIHRTGNRILIDIKLPGVKSSGDIDIDELESSIEVKAVAGNHGYFKIIKKPEFSKIEKKSFENGNLHVEIL